MSDIFTALDYFKSQFNVFEHFKVDKYLCGYGLCVKSEYQGRGIATEILKARIPIMKTLNLEVTSTPYSAIGSQTAANKVGHDVVYEISYDKVEKMFPNFFSLKIATKTFKTQALRL